MQWWTRTVKWISDRLGGRARAQVIFLLAMTIGLEGADLGAVGAMSSILEHAFGIGKSQVGLLITASQGAGSFSTLLFGRLVDRTSRTRLLTIAIAVWSAATIACGAATSFAFLVIARLALGLVVAAALPCTASLIGDFFPERERGTIYGYILSGEMVGTGVGFVLSGELAMVWWRLGFWVLAIPGLLLAWRLYKLPEPPRGGAGHLTKGQREIGQPGGPQPDQPLHHEERLIAQKAREAGVRPRKRLVRDEDPGRQSVWWAVRYVLSIPTNVALIIGSALGYLFFADFRTFGIAYAENWFHLKHGSAVGLLLVVGIGALPGVWLGGYLGDRLLAKGHLPARVWIATGFFWCSAIFLFIAFWLQTLWLAMIFFLGSAFSLGAVNAPLDSARLDIMHPKLWGRAEAVRMMLRDLTEAIGPISFGWLAGLLGGGAEGLHPAFLLMLIPLALAGGVAVVTFRTYPRDAMSAAEYRRRTMDGANSQ